MLKFHPITAFMKMHANFKKMFLIRVPIKFKIRILDLMLLSKNSVQEMLFKIFLIWSSGGPPVQWSRTIYAIFREGIVGNIHVKLYEIETSGSGDLV